MDTNELDYLINNPNFKVLLCLDYPKVEKVPEYLSPSSYMNAINCPHQFFLMRLIKNSMPKEAQGLAASNGSAFDGYIKKRILDYYKIDYDEDDLFKGIEIKGKDRENALQIGQRFCSEYNYYLRLLGMDYDYFKEVEIDEVFKFRGLTLRGKLDCVVHSKYGRVPLDWKVSGSESMASPKQGYYQKVSNSSVCGKHDKCHENITMFEIDEKWAIQLCIYGWLLGFSHKNWEQFDCYIHQLTQNKTGNIQLSLYRGLIPIEYQKILYSNIYKIWDAINDGSYVKRLSNMVSSNLLLLKAYKEKWYM